jgi:hypothetical protein
MSEALGIVDQGAVVLRTLLGALDLTQIVDEASAGFIEDAEARKKLLTEARLPRGSDEEAVRESVLRRCSREELQTIALNQDNPLDLRLVSFARTQTEAGSNDEFTFEMLLTVQQDSRAKDWWSVLIRGLESQAVLVRLYHESKARDVRRTAFSQLNQESVLKQCILEAEEDEGITHTDKLEALLRITDAGILTECLLAMRDVHGYYLERSLKKIMELPSLQRLEAHGIATGNKRLCELVSVRMKEVEAEKKE